MKRKKKLRFKKSRHRRTLDRGSLFPKKELRDVWIKDHFLRIVFPDLVKRMAYISALIIGLEVEPIIPDGQFTRKV